MTRRLALALALGVLGIFSATELSAFGAPSRVAVAPCSSHVQGGVLPKWMSSGFGPNARVTHVNGNRGAIGAVLWNKPLYSPPAKTVNNKILWVPRHYPKTVAALWIKMQKMEGTQTVGAPVRRIVKTGPGPSYVDAPSAGCWRVTLTWSGRQDTLDLQYVPPTD